MIPIRRLAVIAALTLSTTNAIAQDEEGFSGRAGVGFLATTGNTETESININFAMGWHYAPWHHGLTGLAVRSSSAGLTTAEAYGLAWQTDYDISELAYWYGTVAWDKDEFSAYDQQVRETLGYGRHLIDTERHVLDGEIGVGARQSDLRDGTSRNKAILRLSGDYRWRISDTSRFGQTVSIESGSDNTYLEATSSLSSDIMDNVALVVSYKIKSNSDVLPGTKKTDTFLSVSVEYTF